MPTPFRYLLAVLVVAALGSLSALVMSPSESIVHLRLAHSLDTRHSVHKALVFFRQRVQELAAEELQVSIYPSGQLGSERDMIELLQIGSLAMTKVSAGPLEAFVPEMQVFSLPYVFRNSDHYWAVLNSEIGQKLLSAPSYVGLRGMGYFDAGSRSFYTCPKAVHTPADLKGLKIRSMKSKTAVRLMNALGASATPISFGELYSALQQGVVDGAENNVITYYKSKHYEVCKHYTLDRHNSIPDIILISEKVWASLSAKQQAWVQQAMHETVAYQREIWRRDTKAAFARLKQAGVSIIEPDTKLFQQQVQAYKAEFEGTEMGDLLNRIEAL